MTAEAAAVGHRGTRAIQRMVEFAPATGGLALWMPHRDVEGDVPLAATDGITVRYGPGFAALPLPEQVGWVAHEVLHVALRHAQRMQALRQRLGDVDARLFNTCADAIVNSALAHLTWLRLPARALRLETLLAAALGLSTGAEAALLEWDVERLYRAIDDRRAGEPGRRGEQPASAPSAREDGPRAAKVRALAADSVPDLLPDAGEPQAPEAPEAQAEHTRTWGERLLRAHAGDGEHSMLRALLADLPRLRTPWEQVLRTRLARALAQRPAPSWSRPTRSWIANQGRAGPGRRLPWEPGTSGVSTAPRLALVVDVSGSVDDALLARFAGEIEAIARRCEAAMVLVIGDDRVREVVHFEPGRVRLPALTFQGGGGTDFAPLLHEADRHRPDIGVVLTDLQGPAAFRPRWPVVWAVPESHAAAAPPFGRLLVLA